jgi:hypothetical protein
MQTFKQAQVHLLGFFKEAGWTIKTGLKVPHVTSPNGKVRVWFKAQSLHGNDCGTEPKFGNTHSWVSDIRDREHDDINQFMRFIDFCANQE